MKVDDKGYPWGKENRGFNPLETRAARYTKTAVITAAVFLSLSFPANIPDTGPSD